MAARRSHLVALCVMLLAHIASAQIPGDGIPDVYRMLPGFETILTSVGEITRPAGTIIVDTDGHEMVAILIEGPDIITNAADDGSYLIGATAFLPDPNVAPPVQASPWSGGYLPG